MFINNIDIASQENKIYKTLKVSNYKDSNSTVDDGNRKRVKFKDKSSGNRIFICLHGLPMMKSYNS